MDASDAGRPESGGTLLAVDLGLRAGLALYGADGRLRWYRSRNFGSRSRLKPAADTVLRDLGDVSVVVLEGDRALQQIWRRSAERHGAQVLVVSPETWRRGLLTARHQRCATDAKQHADRLARRVIDWSGAPRATSLRHDAAEAILIGLWGVLRVGWLAALPGELR